MKKDMKTKKEKGCLCPYCEEELALANFPFCQACGVVLHYCVRCQITVMDKKATTCPKCGEPLRRGGAKSV